ncbi:MAG: hypothetical protein HON53_18555 [Planctomycetaceae bacterium]|jgi:hypothetical protein|nr:hypothetical protein [Planctomycetaceae bacterium]MBT6158001.1 hypothetical protein [Planctomycetaceae bacterium]MBT6484788.1 hypothetical protein [Planctomycetaceae bacterium]MBT6494115.1 hypothetical protein [Planctomycetaceae bacterium]
MEVDKVVRILHFDDEPTVVGWIPSALMENLLRRFPRSVDIAGSTEDVNDEKVDSQFVIDWPNYGIVQITYHVESTLDSFQKRFKAEATKPAVVTLDAMDEDTDKPNERTGEQLLNWVRDQTPKNRTSIMLLTGYRDELESFIAKKKVEVDDAFLKAPNKLRFVDRLIWNIENELKRPR